MITFLENMSALVFVCSLLLLLLEVQWTRKFKITRTSDGSPDVRKGTFKVYHSCLGLLWFKCYVSADGYAIPAEYTCLKDAIDYVEHRRTSGMVYPTITVRIINKQIRGGTSDVGPR